MSYVNKSMIRKLFSRLLAVRRWVVAELLGSAARACLVVQDREHQVVLWRGRPPGWVVPARIARRP